MKRVSIISMRLKKGTNVKTYVPINYPKPFHVTVSGGDGSSFYLACVPVNETDDILQKIKADGNEASKSSEIECKPYFHQNNKLYCEYNYHKGNYDCKIV